MAKNMNANRTHFLLLITFLMILFGLVNLYIKTIPLTLAHAVYFCQKSLFNSTIPFSHYIPFTLLLFLSSIFIIGLSVLIVQIVKTRLFIGAILKRYVLLPKKLISIAQDLGLQNKIDVIEDRNHFSFCYGLLSTRICLSTSFIKHLDNEELKAVLLHESYHLKNHDPLRIILGKTASLTFFFIPIFKDIQAHYAISCEIAADEVVIKDGNRKSLISALTKLLSLNTPPLYGVAPYRMVQGVVAAFASTDDLERRILYLTDQHKSKSMKLSKRNLALSLAVLLSLFVVLNVPVHAVAISENATDQSYFVCPYGGDCLNSCKKQVESMDRKNYTENVLYTPVK